MVATPPPRTPRELLDHLHRIHGFVFPDGKRDFYPCVKCGRPVPVPRVTAAFVPIHEECDEAARDAAILFG